MTPADPALSFRVLGELVRLLEPGALKLLIAVAGLAVLAGVSLGLRRAALLRASGTLAQRIAPGAGMARPLGRLSLSVFGLALLVLALSRPQCGSRTEVTRRMGLDLVIALDVSRSMLARDVGPDRLTRARLELEALLERLGGDRVGLVVFAGRAFPACPLTSDVAALRVFLRGVGPETVPEQGTGVAAALGTAREILERGGARRSLEGRAARLGRRGPGPGGGGRGGGARRRRHPRLRAGAWAARGRRPSRSRMRRAP